MYKTYIGEIHYISLSLFFYAAPRSGLFFGEVRGGPLSLTPPKKNQKKNPKKISWFRIGKELGDFCFVFENGGGKMNNVYMLCFFIYTQIHNPAFPDLRVLRKGLSLSEGGDGNCNNV